MICSQVAIDINLNPGFAWVAQRERLLGDADARPNLRQVDMLIANKQAEADLRDIAHCCGNFSKCETILFFMESALDLLLLFP